MFSFICFFKNIKKNRLMGNGINFVNIIVEVVCLRFFNEKRKWLELLKMLLKVERNILMCLNEIR